MPVSRTYRCMNCMEGTVTRSYDVSHLTRTCDACGEFERHVNQRVVDQYEAFEADPPEALDWDALDRTRKLIVAERVARHGRSVESLAGDRREPEIEGSEGVDDADPAVEDDPPDDPADERAPTDTALSGESADTTAAGAGDGDESAVDTGDGDDTADQPRERDPAEAGTDPEAEGETDGETPAGHDSAPSGSD